MSKQMEIHKMEMDRKQILQQKRDALAQLYSELEVYTDVRGDLDPDALDDIAQVYHEIATVLKDYV